MSTDATNDKSFDRSGRVKPSLLDAQSIVTIVLDFADQENAEESDHPKQQTFLVYKDFITYHSPFFTAAFNGEVFDEGKTQCMKFDDVEPEIFGMVVHWLYTQKIFRPVMKEYRHEKDTDVLKLGKLWLLADRFLMHDLQNDCMNMMFYELAYNDNFASIKELIALAAGHGLHTQSDELVACTVAYSTESEFEELLSLLSADQAVSVLKRLKIGRPTNMNSASLSSTKFHVAGSEEGGPQTRPVYTPERVRGPSIGRRRSMRVSEQPHTWDSWSLF